MAMKEVEEMFDKIDEINDNCIQKYGQPHQYYEPMKDHIAIQIDRMREAFDDGVNAGRKLSRLTSARIQGKISAQEFSEKEEELVNKINVCETRMENALAELKSNAELLGLPDPQGEHKNARSFARQLLGEYDSFSNAYAKAYDKAVMYDVPFLISEHAPHSKDIMAIANESVKNTRAAMRAGFLPKDYLKDIPKFKHIGKGEYIVTNYLTHIPQDETKEYYKGTIDIIRKDNGKKDTVFVPVMFLPERNIFIINKKDYEEKVKPVGIPIAAVDVRMKKGQGRDPGEKQVIAKAKSVLAQFGYSGKEQSDEKRWNILKSIMDFGILTKQDVMQYMDFRVNMARGNSTTAYQRWNLEKDMEMVENYEPKTEKERKVKNMEYVVDKT